MFSVLQRREAGLSSPTKLYDAAKANKYFIQRLRLERRLEVHRGCVNTICWNESGSSILSGSDDQHLVISNPFTGQIRASIRSGHHSNIFCAKFLPNSQDQEFLGVQFLDQHLIQPKDTKICAYGSIYYTQVDREDTYGKCLFDCHVGTTYELVVVPNEARTFLSCGEDGTVRWFDLRIKTSCNKERCKDDVLINCRNAVTSISVDPVLPYQLATACADGSVRVFDRRMLGTRLSGSYSSRLMTGLVCRFLAPLENKAHRITSLNYSPCSHDILVSYSAENVYLFNTQLEESKRFSKAESEAETKGPANGEQASGTAGLDPTNQPPTKRLRLRGDWSDTGPNARPERERSEDTEGPPQVNLMQRMSDMLTRWLDGSIRRRGEEQEGGAAPPAEGEGGNPQPEQERGAAPLAEGEGGNPQPEQEAADQPILPAAQAIDASLPDTSLPPAQSRDTSLPPAQSGDLPAQQEASPVAQGPEPGRGGGGTLGEVPTVRGEDGGGELLLCDEDGRGTLDGGGLTAGVQGSCEEPRVAGGREVAMDSGCERDRTASDRPEEVGARAEGHCSRALRESEEAQLAPSWKQSETACDSAACMSDAPVAAVSGSGSESVSHVSRSVISQPPQTATSHITVSSDSCAGSSSALSDDSCVQSDRKEAAQTWLESVDLSGPGVGISNDDPRPASCLQHSTVPQPPPTLAALRNH